MGWDDPLPNDSIDMAVHAALVPGGTHGKIPAGMICGVG